MIAITARLMVQELRARRTTAALAASFGVIAGFGLSRAFDAALGHGAWPIAAVALLAVSAAIADATNPGRREDAALLVRLGCPRLLISLAGWSAAVVMIGLPAAIGAQLSDLIGSSVGGGHGSWVMGLALAGAGAATTAGSRLPEAGVQTRAGTRTRLLVRVAAGLALVLVGAVVPALSQTGGDLDFSLPLGTLLVIAGLVIMAPVLVLATSAFAVHAPWAATRVAADSLRQQRRGLTISVAVVAGVSMVFVVQTVVGQGLGDRERDRLAAIDALGPATAGGGAEVAVVDAKRPDFGSGPGRPDPLDETKIAATAGPDATAADIERLQTVALPVGEEYGDLIEPVGFFTETSGGATARATPKLLRALGLNPELATSDRALVLDDRVLGPDHQVLLVGPPSSPPTNRRSAGRRVAAVDAVPGQLWTGLPAVLLPSPVVSRLAGLHVGASSAETAPTSMVVRFPHRPSADQLDAVSAAAGAEAVRGDEVPSLRSTGRTDALVSVAVRTDADARLLGLALAVLAGVALLVSLAALRLAVRRDDALLIELGARRRTLAVVAAVRGAALAGGATVVGSVIGLAATALGLWRYDTHGRFVDEVVLAPITWHVPVLTWAGLAAIPLAAAAIGVALEAIGPRGGSRWTGPSDR